MSHYCGNCEHFQDFYCMKHAFVVMESETCADWTLVNSEVESNG